MQDVSPNTVHQKCTT